MILLVDQKSDDYINKLVVIKETLYIIVDVYGRLNTENIISHLLRILMFKNNYSFFLIIPTVPDIPRNNILHISGSSCKKFLTHTKNLN